MHPLKHLVSMGNSQRVIFWGALGAGVEDQGGGSKIVVLGVGGVVGVRFWEGESVRVCEQQNEPCQIDPIHWPQGPLYDVMPRV